MGEIKSTLDLVMERTRHLSLSDEGKGSSAQRGFPETAAGTFAAVMPTVRYLLKTCGEKIKALQAELKVGRSDGCINGHGGPHGPRPGQSDLAGFCWQNLRRQFAGPWMPALQVYRRQRDDSLLEGAERLRSRLAQDHGISGTAVAPNPYKDPDCQAHLARLRQQAKSRLAAIVDEGT